MPGGRAGRPIPRPRGAQARAAGAVAVLRDAAGAADGPAGVPCLVVADPRAAIGDIAGEIYGHPDRQLELVGVTGTSGKTTTSFLIRAGLVAAGHATGII